MRNRTNGAPRLLLGAAAMLACTSLAHAATNDELEQRVERLEQMLRETQSQLQENRAAQERIERADAAKQSPTRQTKAESKPKQPAEGFRIDDHTTVKIGGYIKADAIVSDYSEGVPGDDGREFYFPNRVPVGDDGGGGTATDFTANQTRINLTTISKLGGHKIKGFVETDFYGGGGNEVVTNSVNPRLRHAFVELDDTWLFGQTWTNFMDLKAYPETLDFVGPSESIVFGRQAQARYTNGNLSIAVENPETTFDAQPNAPEEDLPELTANYSLPTDFGHLGFGGVLREVSSDGLLDDDTPGFDDDDSEVGYGLRFSGRFALGDSGDDIRFSTVYGDGLGRYVGIGTAPAGYVQTDGSVETVSYFAGYIGLKHYWSDEWRSNLVLGTMQIDNDGAGNRPILPGSGGVTAFGGLNKEANSVHANLLWSPVKPLTLGGEYLYADRELENGNDGDLNRLQFSTKYAF